MYFPPLYVSESKLMSLVGHISRSNGWPVRRAECVMALADQHQLRRSFPPSHFVHDKVDVTGKDFENIALSKSLRVILSYSD